MMTVIRDRKTPHAVTANIYGGLSTDTVWADCFKDNDEDGPCVKKHIPKSQVYVAANTQGLEDYKFTSKDLRPTHTTVWNQKAKNYKKYGKFMTNYQLAEYNDRASLANFVE